MENILITGGLGFIGSAIIKKLQLKNYNITIMDNTTTNTVENIDNCEIIKTDITNLDSLKKIKINKIDTILHLAGQSSGPASSEDPIYDAKCNIIGTLNLLEFARMIKVNRILFASTFAVYGDPINDLCLKENDPTNPKSVYGISKLACENYIRILSSVYKFNWNILRMFNVYGYGQDLSRDNQGIISIFIKLIKENTNIPVTGSLKRIRDFVNIEDVVQAWILCLENKNYNNKIYNVGCGKPDSIKEMINEIALQYNKFNKIRINETEGTIGDILGCYANIDNISNDLGYRPAINLKKGIQIFKKWVDSN